MKMIKINKVILGTLVAFLFLGLSTIQTYAQTPVKGQNVTKVTFGNNDKAEGILVQVEPKKWNHYYPDGKRLWTTHNETGRDEWSVYLTNGNLVVVVNLFKKTVTYSKQMSYTGKIMSSSNTPISTSTVTRSTSSTTPKPPSPLTPNEMSRVMNWISVKTSAARMPFCWRKSFGRGVGKIMNCRKGLIEDNLVCVTPCKANEQGFDSICYPRNCPAGFRNDGLYCGKPAAYGRGLGYAWKGGDTPFSLDGARARCRAANRQGCEKSGAIIYPKCRAGFKNAGSNVCSPICPSGYADIGVSCKKPTSERLYYARSVCPDGTVKDPTGLLCYPACGPGNIAGVQEKYSGGGPKNNYKGVGPVCWQNCPSQQNFDCGAGCATTEPACAKAVFDMTSAPIIAALKIAGLVATAGASTGLTTSVAGGKLASKLPRLKPLFVMADRLKRFAKTYKTSIDAGKGTKTMIFTLKSETELFATEFAKNFGDMTSPEIEKMIDKEFSPAAAVEIKKEWGRHHVGMMMEANAINTAKNFLSIAGIADPTGLVGVVKAFTNPLCKDDTPFPTVNPKY